MAKKPTAEDGQESGEGQATGGKEAVSKMEAVRRLLGEDPEMKPTDGVEAIKKRFGLEMSTANFSAYKSQIRAAQAKAAGGEKPKRGRKPAQATAAPVGADPLEAAQAVKALVDRYGAGTVKGLADLFGQEGHG